MKKYKSLVLLFIYPLLFVSCGKNYVSPAGNSGSVAGTSGTLARFVINNNTLYTVANYSLTSYDITDSTNPTLNKTSYGYYNLDNIFSSGNYLYIGGQGAITIYDVSNGGIPVKQSAYTNYYSCDYVTANSKYAFITLRTGSDCYAGTTSELDVVDITNPALPKKMFTYPLSQPYGLALDGNTLFVADGGIIMYDATDVSHLVQKQKVIINASDLIAQNGKLMAIGSDGLYQYDYSSGSLVFLSKISTK